MMIACMQTGMNFFNGYWLLSLSFAQMYRMRHGSTKEFDERWQTAGKVQISFCKTRNYFFGMCLLLLVDIQNVDVFPATHRLFLAGHRSISLIHRFNGQQTLQGRFFVLY